MGFAGARGRSPPNVIILVFDTARAMNFSCYGNDRETTPTIDALAADGVRFSRATSVSPWTLPSHASLFTGVPPSSHRTNSLQSKLPESLPTLAEILSDYGYDTVGMSANPWFSSHFGITRGFDRFHHLFGPFATDSYREFVTELTNASKSIPDRAATLLSSQSPQELARNTLTATYRQLIDRDDDGAKEAVDHASDIIGQSDPYFLFINFLEPHLPFEPPTDCWRRFVPSEITDERLESINQDATAYNIRNVEMEASDFDLLERLYDAEIYHVDRQIRKLLDSLDSAGQREDTIVCVLGDHGENIGDHGLMAHHYSVHETLLHVPLVLRYPRLFEDGETVDKRVSSLDIPVTLATILGDLGIADERFHAQQRGIPLHELANKNRNIVAEYLKPMPPIDRLRAKSENSEFDVSYYDRTLRAIYDDDIKFVRGSDGHRALYDVFEDYQETTNLFESRSARAADLEGKLEQWIEENDPESAAPSASVDEHVQERLGDLGYL